MEGWRRDAVSKDSADTFFSLRELFCGVVSDVYSQWDEGREQDRLDERVQFPTKFFFFEKLNLVTSGSAGRGPRCGTRERD